MKAETSQAVVRNCLHVRAMPPSLTMLWERSVAGDNAVGELFGVEQLLTNLKALDEGYGAHISEESDDAAANIGAFHEIFEQLGFFAEVEDGEFLAFYLRDTSPEPAVVKLDNEGSFSWAGANLAEALFRLAENIDAGDEAKAWLAEHGLLSGDVETSELGASTQFLPNLDELHKSLYAQRSGTPKPASKLAPVPARPGDPRTWIGRPGDEVKAALAQVLGAAPVHFCAWCDGGGLVHSVELDAQTKTTTLCGVALGATQATAAKVLGEPTKQGKNWAIHAHDGFNVRLGFDAKGAVSSFTLRRPD